MKQTFSFISSFGILTVLSGASFAAPMWTIDPTASHLTFEVKQGDNPITGEFKKFTPTIEFDKADLTTSHIKVKVETGSAETGDKSNDSSLPSKDWFNIATFPSATFESASITNTGPDKVGLETFEAKGKLTILGVTREVVLPFTLKTDGDNTHASGTLALKRLDYGMGALIDPNSAMVSNDVTVKFDITAHVTPANVPVATSQPTAK
jgi:polyisoprenoid-binding protein YceI